jgi:hypothetical protein
MIAVVVKLSNVTTEENQNTLRKHAVFVRVKLKTLSQYALTRNNITEIRSELHPQKCVTYTATPHSSRNPICMREVALV